MFVCLFFFVSSQQQMQLILKYIHFYCYCCFPFLLHKNNFDINTQNIINRTAIIEPTYIHTYMSSKLHKFNSYKNEMKVDTIFHIFLYGLLLLLLLLLQFVEIKTETHTLALFTKLQAFAVQCECDCEYECGCGGIIQKQQ